MTQTKEEAYRKDVISMMNAILNSGLNNSDDRARAKGTATYYIAGEIKNRKFCYTRQKTYYHSRFGFWSWIQTSYMNGRIKRTKFAKSGSKIKAQNRARRLYDSELQGEKLI